MTLKGSAWLGGLLIEGRGNFTSSWSWWPQPRVLDLLRLTMPLSGELIGRGRAQEADTVRCGALGEYLGLYIDDFAFHFNRRSWNPKLPDRLLQAAVDHVPNRALPAYYQRHQRLLSVNWSTIKDD